MSAFFIGLAKIKDREAFAQYGAAYQRSFERFGGVMLARGSRVFDVVGEDGPEVSIVVWFPTMTKLEEWFNCGDYQALIPLRDKAIDLTITAFENLNFD